MNSRFIVSRLHHYEAQNELIYQTPPLPESFTTAISFELQSQDCIFPPSSNVL